MTAAPHSQEARDSISEYQASRAAAEEQKREAERAPVREVRQGLLLLLVVLFIIITIMLPTGNRAIASQPVVLWICCGSVASNSSGYSLHTVAM
jgi:type VI protein secretion system component VasF